MLSEWTYYSKLAIGINNIFRYLQTMQSWVVSDAIEAENIDYSRFVGVIDSYAGIEDDSEVCELLSHCLIQDGWEILYPK